MAWRRQHRKEGLLGLTSRRVLVVDDDGDNFVGTTQRAIYRAMMAGYYGGMQSKRFVKMRARRGLAQGVGYV